VISKQPQRVVLVVESPFSARDEARFGVRELTAAGLLVEVWDICDITLPEARKQWIAPTLLDRVYSFDSWPAVEQLAGGLGSHDTVVLLCGVSGRLDRLHAPLLDAVLRSPALVGAFVGATVPREAHAASVRARVRNTLSAAKSRLTRSFKPARTLDFVWAGTTTETIARPLVGNATVVRFIHSLDFDLILEFPRLPPSHDDFVLFLDAMGPLHPDYVTLGLKNDWSVEAYRTLMAAVLAAIENVGRRLVVAAHPRARPGSLEELYPGFEVRHGETSQLIRRCAYVLTIEGSTSLAMAAYFAKPVLFVDDPVVPEATKSLAGAFRLALRAPKVQVGAGLKSWQAPVIDEEAFDEYVVQHLKKPGSPETRFCDLVAADIRSRLVIK
jgi:hypothetical protein